MMRFHTTWARRALRPAALAVVAVLVVPVALWAHAHLERSEPAAGATLTVAPTQLKFWFSEAPQLAVSRVTLVGAAGDTVPLAALQHGDDQKYVFVDISRPLAEGRYRVDWRAVAADGHPSSGSFTFGVVAASAARPEGAAPASGSTPQPGGSPAESAVTDVGPSAVAQSMAGMQMEAGPSVAQVAAQFVQFSALMILIGGLAFVLLVLPRAADVPADVRARAANRTTNIVVGAAGLLLLSAAARLLMELQMLRGMLQDPVSATTVMTGTAWGHGWLAQVVATFVLLAVVSRLHGVVFRGIAVAAALVLAATPGLSGHAAASAVMPWLAVGSAGVHVLAAGAWLGSLLLVATVGIPVCTRSSADTRWSSVASLVRAFSPVALISGMAVVVTGIINARLRVGGPHLLVTTEYGQTLIVKLVLVAVALAIGAFNWRRLRPSLGTGQATATLQKSARVELLVALLIVLVTAVLVGLPTPR